MVGGCTVGRGVPITQMSPVEAVPAGKAVPWRAWTIPAEPAAWEAHVSDFLAGDPYHLDGSYS